MRAKDVTPSETRGPKLRVTLIAAVSAAFACSSAVTSGSVGVGPQSSYDVVISDGRVIDGTGNAWFYGDVGVTKDRIAWVGPAGSLAKAKAGQRIDAKGMVVAPGFIDIQSGSYDNFLVGDGRSLSKVTQGVTTEIMGEAYTLAPWNDSLASFVPFFFLDEDTTAARAALKGFGGPHGFGAWLHAMERHGTSPNVGSFVGATTLRMYGMGQAAGAADPAQLDTMRAVMRGAMEDGAFGLGTALIYPPGNYASTEELIEMAKAMAPYGGVYITHMRSEADHFLEAIDEAIRIGRDGGVPVEIYHLKAAGKRNWHKAAQAIAKIDSARAAGQDVPADMYPYTAGGTGLAACLPPWASADGKLFEQLADPATRAKIKAAGDGGAAADWENLCQLATPEGVLLGDFKDAEEQAIREPEPGRDRRGAEQDWADALIDLTLEEKARPGAVFFLMTEENVELQLRQPWIKFGTDAGGADPANTHGSGPIRAPTAPSRGSWATTCASAG